MEFENFKVRYSKYDIQRDIKLPLGPSVELAEFIGILTGDGHISFEKRPNVIFITGNSVTDYNYLTVYVPNLIRYIFNISPYIYLRKNAKAIVIRFRSRAIKEYFDKMGYYKLRTEIKIPSWILQKKYSIHFLRGLIDTDGSVFVSKKPGIKQYPCIELTTVSLHLANLVKSLLTELGFRVAKVRSYKYKQWENLSFKVSLYGQKNLLRWIEIIGFSNSYKNSRACDYKEWGGGDLNTRRIRLQRIEPT